MWCQQKQNPTWRPRKEHRPPHTQRAKPPTWKPVTWGSPLYLSATMDRISSASSLRQSSKHHASLERPHGLSSVSPPGLP